jgi:hypothetical protein
MSGLPAEIFLAINVVVFGSAGFYMDTFYIRRLENQRLLAFTLQSRFSYSTEVNATL